MKKIFSILILTLLVGCESSKTLPKPESLIDDAFSIDKNINMNTIDNYLNLPNVVYRDVRMLFDPASFEEIGGEADLTSTIEGFKIVPYPYIASLQALPVKNAYSGNTLFDVKWNENGKIDSLKPLYEESYVVIDELFPKDKKIFLMCGGGGYANMMKEVLIHIGYDKDKIYNVGANWTYKGKHKKELIIYPEDINGNKIYASWRADYAYIPFEKMHKLN